MAAKPKMTAEQWASTRAAWEADPREGYAWLVETLALDVSAPGVRKAALKNGWAKVKRPVSIAPNGKVSKVSQQAKKNHGMKDAAQPVGAAQDLPEGDEAENETSGRPTLYRPEYATLAKNYALLGADDAQLAEFFDVSERTINRWKVAHPEFSEALRVGKAEADARVAHSLYQRATGCSHPDTHVSNFQGEITLTPLIKHYPPDVQAATFWLKNRQPASWKDRVEVKAEIKGDPFPPKEVLDAIYAKALAEAAQMEAKLAGRRERLGIVIENRDGED